MPRRPYRFLYLTILSILVALYLSIYPSTHLLVCLYISRKAPYISKTSPVLLSKEKKRALGLNVVAVAVAVAAVINGGVGVVVGFVSGVMLVVDVVVVVVLASVCACVFVPVHLLVLEHVQFLSLSFLYMSPIT